MTPPHLRPIDTTPSVRGRVGRALRAAIISGEMSPGEVYSAPHLGDRFGVSATPVREAMLDLIKEGLVERMPNRGFRVTQIDGATMDEIAQLRELLEPPVVRDVVATIPEADLPGLRERAERIVTHAAENDLLGYLDADTAFHLSLLRYAGNQRLLRLVEDLRAQARLSGISTLAERGELAASASEHVQIVDGIQARDPERVYALMLAHIRHTRGAWGEGDPKPGSGAG